MVEKNLVSASDFKYPVQPTQNEGGSQVYGAGYVTQIVYLQNILKKSELNKILNSNVRKKKCVK
jgi:hypothetical protein